MRTNSRRREQGLVLAVLTVVLSLPELARAQQGGLFPLSPITRKRVPCDQEDPIYKIYKHQYFGYHPTCWRKFPEGWGCPSREAPNKEQAFKDLPLLSGTDENPDTMKPEDETPAEGGRPGGRQALPNPPTNERSPFDMDKPDTTPAPPRGRQAPPPRDDPFDTAPGATPRASRSPRPTSSPLSDSDVPVLSAPADQPVQSQGARSARNDDENRAVADEAEDGPILALPNLSLPPADDAGAGSYATNPASTTPTPRAATWADQWIVQQSGLELDPTLMPFCAAQSARRQDISHAKARPIGNRPVVLRGASSFVRRPPLAAEPDCSPIDARDRRS